MTAPPPTEDLLRELSPRVLGAVVRRTGDFDAAEDAVQEALLAAATHWPVDGFPENPHGWLVAAAVRRLTDQVRSEQARRRREELAARRVPPPGPVDDRDDTLVLFFMCAHPSLTSASAIALTLRAVGGLTTAEIARAFLVPESTMAQRISRAKASIASSGVPFRLPEGEERVARLRQILHVLYLIFNEGYASSTGSELVRTALSAEAIRLTRAIHALLPESGEVAGLLALMLLTDARRPARTGPGGELVPLAEQDRSQWDEETIAEGVALAVAAMSRPPMGEYQLLAAINAVHDEAARAADTDWPQILGLYDVLERLSGNPMVTLNRAVALGMVQGPAAGLAVLDTLDEKLRGNHRVDAARGHLLERAGDPAGAAASYELAARRATSLAEQRFLATQAARLRHQASVVESG